MRTLTYFAVAAFILASCDKTEMPDLEQPPSYNDIYHMFEANSIDSTEWFIDEDIPGRIYVTRLEDFEPYSFHVTEAPCSAPAEMDFIFPVADTGYFSIDTVIAWVGDPGNRVDHITGAGYFSPDTAYLHYYYTEIESGQIGRGSVYSLFLMD